MTKKHSISRLAGAAAAAMLLGTTPALAAPAPAHRHMREHHPAIMRAEHLVARAKRILEHAAHDFGGHRVAAIKHLDEALTELRAAQAADKK